MLLTPRELVLGRVGPETHLHSIRIGRCTLLQIIVLQPIAWLFDSLLNACRRHFTEG